MRVGFFLFLWFVGCAEASSFREELEHKALNYFLDHAHPVSGLVRDRARNFEATPDTLTYRCASLAATGFGMAVIANASQRGLIPLPAASTWILRVLKFAKSHLDSRQGWLYHFVDWETGARFGKSEISTIDTALFVSGALYAAAAFPESEISDLARTLYERMDFTNMLTDGGARPQKKTLSMGWTPEEGFLRAQWDSYAEHLLLLLLGLGHPSHPLPQQAWSAGLGNSPELGQGLPLFVHQYSQLFLDVRDLPAVGQHFFENSVAATLSNRRLCQSDARYAGYWGVSASDSREGYLAFSPQWHNGTVCPACAGASAMFLPEIVLGDLESWAEGPHRAAIWGRYGFVDSLNVEAGWFGPDVLGITVGPLFLSLANLTEASVWSTFRKVPALARGIRKTLPPAPCGYFIARAG